MKPTKQKKVKPVFKSDRSWGGKVILTGEKVARPEGTMGTAWTNVRYDFHGDHHKMYRDGIYIQDIKCANAIGDAAADAQSEQNETT